MTKTRGRGRGRPSGRASKKAKKTKTSAKEGKGGDEANNEKFGEFATSPKFDTSSDSELTSPTISFVSSTSNPLHLSEPLNWRYKVNLMGEKVVNPRIHCCDACLLPILVYGRMIPCKHVFCFSCGKKNGSICPRCNDKVLRVEKSSLGKVFMCQTESCRRTYLSERDLQAHIQHRHLRRSTSSSAGHAEAGITSQTQSLGVVSGSAAGNYQSHIPVVTSRSNLMTMSSQDEIGSMSKASSSKNPCSNYPLQSSFPHNPHLQWSASSTVGQFPLRQSQWPPVSIPTTSAYSLNFNRTYFQQ